MRLFRAISAACLALLFLVSTNTCAVAAALSEQGATCCESPSEPVHSEEGAPCSRGACAPCATLESGVNLGALIPLSLPAPSWIEQLDLAALLRQWASAALDRIPLVPLDPVRIPSPPWPSVVTQALPVRGPSLAA